MKCRNNVNESNTLCNNFSNDRYFGQVLFHGAGLIAVTRMKRAIYLIEAHTINTALMGSNKGVQRLTGKSKLYSWDMFEYGVEYNNEQII